MANQGECLANRYEAFLLDLDGVVYRGDDPVHGASEAIEELRRRGRRVVFITNNSAPTPQAVVATLESMGVQALPEDVVTSAQAAIPLVRDRIGRAGTVFAIGEEGVRSALEEEGMTLLDGNPEKADAVVVGWDRRADYDKLRTASVLVQRGARLIATNADVSYPAPGGDLWPGTGALLAVIEQTTGAKATVAGKPHPPLFEAALERVGTPNALVIGDRLETDVAGAAAAGLDAALVLTGAATPSDVVDHDVVPVAVLRDLGELFTERPDVRIRIGTPDDEEQIRELVKEAGLAETETHGLKSESSALIAEADDAAVATAMVRIRDADSYLHSVVVRPGEQGLGLGTLMVARALSAARRAGASRCFLVTETASGFFSKLGFQPTDRDYMPEWIRNLARECATSATSMERALAQ
jgi:HAD superfamily hydrolase (TIGR01457 family)